MADETIGTLTYKRTRLVEMLNEALNKNIKEREEKKEKAAAQNKEAKDKLVAALDNPRFLVWVIDTIAHQWSAADPTLADFAKTIADTWPESNGDEMDERHDPDYQLRRLIKLYENADDENVQVDVNNDARRYL